MRRRADKIQGQEGEDIFVSSDFRGGCGEVPQNVCWRLMESGKRPGTHSQGPTEGKAIGRKQAERREWFRNQGDLTPGHSVRLLEDADCSFQQVEHPWGPGRQAQA